MLAKNDTSECKKFMTIRDSIKKLLAKHSAMLSMKYTVVPWKTE